MVGYDGMRQPLADQTDVEIERWVYTAFSRVVLVLDRTQLPFKTCKTPKTAAAATAEARLASLFMFPRRPCSTSNGSAAAPVCVPISIPSFAHQCLASMSQSPAIQNGNRNKEERNTVSETTRQRLSCTILACARYGRGQAWSIWAKATGQKEADVN